MKKVLVIDNYDSFTYNLVHYLEDLGCEVVVRRNDKIRLEEVDSFERILLSPGPGIPEEAGLLKEIIRRFGPHKQIFGVCLGQQAIGEVYGGQLVNLEKVYHGIASPVTLLEDDYIFEGLPETITVGRYHSWVVDPRLPDCLVAIARDASGQLMALRHKTYDIRAVQFHPESVLTPDGKKILENWLNHET